jgi:3-deoxy-7-phosphoheptulonate synthase/chorismate mutase
VTLHDPEREEQMLRDLLRANRGPLDSDRLVDLFRQIFAASLSSMERSGRRSLRVHRRPGEADRRVEARGHALGGGTPQLVAGPCAVEDPDQVCQVARRLKELGCGFLRGGAFKPRTSPYAFQGLGGEGWRILRAAADELGMAVVSEVLDVRHLDEAVEQVDVLQVGTRNMFNYELLKALGRQPRPVLLKRSFMATLEEYLLAAEYVAAGGNDRIVLCERGIRTFERWTRATLDISAVPLLKQATALPVVVDVAHAAGRRDILIPLAKAALAAGADGVMVEVHPDPAMAVSDRDHQLDLEAVAALHREVFG